MFNFQVTVNTTGTTTAFLVNESESGIEIKVALVTFIPHCEHVSAYTMHDCATHEADAEKIGSFLDH